MHISQSEDSIYLAGEEHLPLLHVEPLGLFGARLLVLPVLDVAVLVHVHHGLAPVVQEGSQTDGKNTSHEPRPGLENKGNYLEETQNALVKFCD